MEFHGWRGDGAPPDWSAPIDIDFTRLRYFVAVAEELHFKHAADRLMITPPPLSKQIRVLEQELGGALFERDYHEVRLTPLGSMLLDPAREILERVDALRAMAATTPAVIRIGATSYAATPLIERLERGVAGLPSPATFRVEGSAVEITARLLADQLDLGVIHLPATDERILHRSIWHSDGAIAVRGDDPLAGRESVRLEELRDRQVVIDFARANPTILAEQAEKLAAHNVTRIVHAATGRGGEVEMAAQVYNRRLVAMIAYEPDSSLGRIFSPPQFAMVRVEPEGWEPRGIALAWTAASLRRVPQLESIIDTLADSVTRAG